MICRFMNVHLNLQMTVFVKNLFHECMSRGCEGVKLPEDCQSVLFRQMIEKADEWKSDDQKSSPVYCYNLQTYFIVLPSAGYFPYIAV